MSWAYLNFLHVGKYIFIPMMEDKLGEIAFRQIADAFPQCECNPIYHYENIVHDGGALNCSTWNILTNSHYPLIRYDDKISKGG